MIQPSPTALLGSVTTLESYSPSDFPPSAVVLCRNTAPLIAFAFQLIRKNVGVRVAGRDFGTGLITLVERTNSSNIPELSQKLEVLRDKEIKSAIRRNNSSALAAIEDKYECLNLFVVDATSIANLTSKIAALFDDKTKGLLTLSTIHRAKGLEWPTVFILDRKLMPSKYAKADWELRQESNLMYVAITRAKLDLKYISSGCWATNQQH